MEILRPIMPKSTPGVKESATSASPLANLFEHLVVEEPSETASHSNVEA
jgi:hypothetical protein